MLMSRKLLTGICLCLALSLLLTQGCTKKPKINLSDLRNTPVGAGSRSGGTGADNGFVPGSLGLGTGDFGPNGGSIGGVDGVGGVGGDGSAWVGTDQPVGGLPGENFLTGATPWNQVVYFAYDSAEVAPGERYKLEELAQKMLGTAGSGVVIEGHCDDRGSDEYNRGLSERRALAVREYLQTLGVVDDSMMTVSYGEDRPVVANATTEGEHQQNRRAEFLLGTKK